MDLVGLLFYCAGAVAILALPILIVNCIRYARAAASVPRAERWADFPIKTVGFFVVPILIVIAIASIVVPRAREEVLGFLNELSGTYAVSINDRPASDPAMIVTVLKGMYPSPEDRSSPSVERIRVAISGSRGTLNLELARTRGNHQDYRVYYPKSPVTAGNEIGRIRTGAFDNY